MGAVNVLVGENGAGKSTLMKVIAGVEQPTAGEIVLDGEAGARSPSPARRRAHGIGIVFQELNLFPNLAVATTSSSRGSITRGGIDIDGRRSGQARGADASGSSTTSRPRRWSASSASASSRSSRSRRRCRADARILILDEPTSALRAAEVEILFRVIADLRRKGVGIVYISHRLEELIRIGDWITVLRDGGSPAGRAMAGVGVPWIVRNMIGAASKDYAARGHAPGAEVFRRRGDHAAAARRGRASTSVAVAARGRDRRHLRADGSGADRALRGDHGAASARDRAVLPRGQHSWRGTSPGGSPRGIALIPEDRSATASGQIMSVAGEHVACLAAATSRAGSSPRRGARGAGRLRARARDQGGEPGARDQRAVRRQPAEGGDRQGADDRGRRCC